MNKKGAILKICITAIAASALIAFGMFLAGKLGQSKNDKHLIAGTVDKYAEDQNYDDLTENVSISIPGYESFEFVADKLKQDVVLHNPKENTCYFKISFILENGKKIWTSELLEPGMSFTSINLEKSLKAGIYENVQIKYECYSLKNLEKLNGADIKVTLFVK